MAVKVVSVSVSLVSLVEVRVDISLNINLDFRVDISLTISFNFSFNIRVDNWRPIEQLIGFKKNLITTKFTILHLTIQSQHLSIQPINCPTYLSSHSSHRIAVPSHVRIHQRHLLKRLVVPHRMQGH